MIRSIFAVLSIIIIFIVSFPVLGVLWLISRKSPQKARNMALKFAQGYWHVLLFLCGTKQTVKGLENIPKDQKVLYIINHRSMLDIPLTMIHCPGLTGYVSKIEIKKVPVLNWWMEMTRCLFLDRKDIRQGLKVILQAIDQVKNDESSIAIFPEGTRNRNADERELLEFHEGSFKIAAKTGCPIIPVAISGSSRILEDHFPFIRGTHVTVEYGKPIMPKELSKEEQKFIGKHVQSVLGEMLKNNYEEK